jgi:hypothetical protein
MPSPFFTTSQVTNSYGRGSTPVSPAPISEEPEMEEGNPPPGELGSSFMMDAPFGQWENGNVFAYEEPLVRDYQHMLDTDGTAQSIELMLTYPIISAPWSIEPAKGDTGEAEFIYDALTALPHQGGPLTTVEQLVSQMTAAFTNKRAYFEKVFKLNDDGKVVYHKLAYRPPETCELALDARRAEPRGFRQMPIVFESAGNHRPNWNANIGDWVYVPRERAFVYVHGTHRNPLLGESDMKVPYWCFQTKRKIRWLWYQFLDQSVLPKTIVKNADETQARVDARKVSTLRGRGVVALLDSTTVEAYEASSKAADEYQSAMTYLDNEMLNSGLLGYMGLSSAAGEGKGSYALAESLSKMYLRTRRMVAMDMARQITNDVIGPLIAYNFGPKGVIPRFKFGPLREANEVNVLDVFNKVATTGAKVPVEFYDQLVTRVATLLELDPGKVAKAIEVEGSPQEADNVAQQLGTAVDTATKMVQDHQTQQTNDAARKTTGGAPVKAAASRGGGTVGTRPFGERSVVKPKQSRKRRP